MTLLKLFVNTLRQNLPRLPNTGTQLRHITAMEVAPESDKLVPNKNRTRFRKRQWEDNTTKVNGAPEEKRDKPFERIKRKKMAMLLGYCGVDYYGMQRNPGVRTIEEDLLKALLEAKYINEEDFTTQQNTQFQRSSRTDKGVSASRQVVSLKLPLEVSVEEINKGLPECIRVFDVKRVTNKFNSKCKCNARTYSYTLPTFAFEPSLSIESGDERKRYRISSDKMQQINSVLGYYKGTKCYHNFTEKKHFQDPSSSRYMMGFSIDKVFIESDLEFAVLLVKGQSFMLHQIRKMIGLTIAVCRGLVDISIMDKVFGKEKVMIPTAPGLGLVLDKVHYDRYDTKFKDSHDSLTWTEVEDTVQKFTHEHIFPNIIKGEIQDESMATWLEKLKGHSYEPSDDAPVEKDGEKDDTDDEQDDDVVEDEENNTEEVKHKNEEASEKKNEVSEVKDERSEENNSEKVGEKNEVSEGKVEVGEVVKKVSET
ncbi:pseudouridylate synthase 1 homolog isoform X1 [Cydia strobilella]|uniref:pseudouridylate synthase 1 homolog isoform X1 n=2 Tax=Cydia strobilella TaxID=1100964 RepID=UPI003007E4D4